MRAVVVDTNLLLLLIAGTAGRHYIGMHKNIQGHFTVEDFDLLTQAISLYSDIVLLPHVMSEVSSLARQIRNPERHQIQSKLAQLIEVVGEVYLPSREGAGRPEFDRLGLTDSVVLQLCALDQGRNGFALLTADDDLAVQAEMLEYEVLNFNHLR